MDENPLSHEFIGAAIEVHKELGPGLLEGIYEKALCHELSLRELPFQRQQQVPIIYKEVRLGSDLRLDLIVGEKVIVDLKAKENVMPVDKAQLLSYLRLCDLRLGLIINFHVAKLTNGVFRVVNQLNEK